MELEPGDLCADEDIPSSSDEEESGAQNDKKHAQGQKEDAMHHAQKDLDDMVNSFTSFLNRASAFEGVEVDGSSEDSDVEIDFDVDRFLDAIKPKPEPAQTQAQHEVC